MTDYKVDDIISYTVQTDPITYTSKITNIRLGNGYTEYLVSNYCGMKVDGVVFDFQITKPSKKRYNTMSNIGHAKYVVNYCGGIKKHSDGSDFFDIAIFKNKKKLNDFLLELVNDGYIQAKMGIYS